MSCGCADQNCSCNFAAGSGLTLDGNGTRSNPFVFEATGGGSGTLNTADTSSLVWTKTGAGTPDDPVILSANVAVSVPVPSTQLFVNNGTWNKPGGVTRVRVIVQGGGGGGAGGPKQSSPTDFRFAQGGGGGFYTVREFAAADVPASVAITVGNGGTAGTGATSVGNGGNGGAGGTSSFGTLLSAPGGAAGTDSTDPALISAAPSGGGVPGLAPGGGGFGGTVSYGGTTVTGVRTNLIVNPNFESNIAGWSAYDANSTVAHAAPEGAAMQGALALRVSGSAAVYTNDAINTVFIPVTPGLPYTFSMLVQRNASAGWAGALCRVFFDFYTASGSTSGAGATTPALNLNTPNVNYTLTHTFTPPSGYTRMKLHFQGESGRTQLSTTSIFYDRLMLEQSSTANPYFDGSTPDTSTVDYAWTGTANASTSTATTTAGLQVFNAGGAGADVPAGGLFGGSGGAGGGTGTSSSVVGVGGAGGIGLSWGGILTNLPGGSGGGGGGAGSTPGGGGAGVAGSGGGGGAAGITPQNGAAGGPGGKGFVTVIAW